MEPADGELDNTPTQKAKVVTKWTPAEVDALHRALAKHGHRWTVIKQDPEFAKLLWRPVKGLQSKWQQIDPVKREAGLSPGGVKRKDGPGKKEGKPKKQAKRVSPEDLLTRAFSSVPTLSELSVQSDDEDEMHSDDLADSLVAHLMESEKEVGGLEMRQNEGGEEGEVHGEENGATAGAEELEVREKEKGVKNVPGIDIGQTAHEDVKQPEGGGGESVNPPAEMDSTENPAVEAIEKPNLGGSEVAGAKADGGLSGGQEGSLEDKETLGAAEGEAKELEGAAPQTENGAPQEGVVPQPETGVTHGGGSQRPENAPPQAETSGLPNIDLNASHQPEEAPVGTAEFENFYPMQEDGHFEDEPNGKEDGFGAGLPGLAELNPDWGVEDALGFFPEEELPQELENAVLAAKRAEVHAVEGKTRVLERKRDAWMRAFEKKRAQYEARMANVESVCRARELAQEEQRKVVYQEKWALEAARQAAAQLLQDLLTLVPSPDGISLDRLHPQMTWESTFGPQCVIRRQIVEQHFQKQQRAVSMLQAAALDAHRKKLAMSKRLGLDVRDEELTSEDVANSGRLNYYMGPMALSC